MANSQKETIVLSTGVRVQLKPISRFVLAQVATKKAPPKVPTWFNPDKARNEENPNDPDYLAAVEKHNLDQAMSIIDGMVSLGITLVDGVPPTEEWLPGLRMLHRLGRIDLGIKDEDFDDPHIQEYLYKRHVAIDQDDFVKLQELMGIAPEAVDSAAEIFPGDEKPDTDS